MTKSILQFVDEYGFLSNFHPSEVEYEGEIYPTVEHAYQAAKTIDVNLRRQIREARTPGQAKKLGNRVNLIPNWDNLRLNIMEDLLQKKFKHPELRTKLKATGNAYLEEGNWWGDRFWGVCNRVGENHLGRLLMKIRDSIY